MKNDKDKYTFDDSLLLSKHHFNMLVQLETPFCSNYSYCSSNGSIYINVYDSFTRSLTINSAGLRRLERLVFYVIDLLGVLRMLDLIF